MAGCTSHEVYRAQRVQTGYTTMSCFFKDGTPNLKRKTGLLVTDNILFKKSKLRRINNGD